MLYANKNKQWGAQDRSLQQSSVWGAQGAKLKEDLGDFFLGWPDAWR